MSSDKPSIEQPNNQMENDYTTGKQLGILLAKRNHLIEEINARKWGEGESSPDYKDKTLEEIEAEEEDTDRQIKALEAKKEFAKTEISSTVNFIHRDAIGDKDSLEKTEQKEETFPEEIARAFLLTENKNLIAELKEEQKETHLGRNAGILGTIILLLEKTDPSVLLKDLNINDKNLRQKMEEIGFSFEHVISGSLDMKGFYTIGDGNMVEKTLIPRISYKGKQIMNGIVKTQKDR